MRITAEVEEAGRGTKQSDTISFPLVANPVRVRLADDNPQLHVPSWAQLHTEGMYKSVVLQ